LKFRLCQESRQSTFHRKANIPAEIPEKHKNLAVDVGTLDDMTQGDIRGDEGVGVCGGGWVENPRMLHEEIKTAYWCCHAGRTRLFTA